MRLLLTCAAALLYAFGWAAGLFAVLLLWCWSQAAVGWDDARRLDRRDSMRTR